MCHRRSIDMATKKSYYLEILLGKGAENMIMKVQCEKPGCKSTDIKIWEFATRSADEGVTIFHKCRECGYVWACDGQ